MKKIYLFFTVFILILTTLLTSFADSYSSYRDKFIEGYIKEIHNNKIIIEEYDGTLHILNILLNTKFNIDGVPVKLEDFKPGMEIYAELKGRSISYMESYSTDKMGYIEPQSKMRSGVVQKIDRNQITIKSFNNEKMTFFTSPATIVLKSGKNVDLSVICIGDSVKVFFDDINLSIASKIEIEGKSILIKKIYKGKLTNYDEMENLLILSDIKELKNGAWEYYQNTMKIYFNDEIPIFIGGNKVSYENLKFYKDRTIYFVVKDIFGQEKIERMVIKSKYETIYTSKIDKINWYSESMELSNKRNISFNDGTIFVKSDRIVDKYSINPESDALIIADGRNGLYMADVVYIYNESINNSNIGQNYIYVARLDEIVKDKLIGKDFYVLKKNEWRSFRKEKEFYYDEDTYIYDLENKKQISTKDFYSENYAVDEDSDYAEEHKLRDWYGYMYTDGDKIIAISVKEKLDSLLRQRVTTGVVIEDAVEDSLVGYTIKLANARDWSRSKNKWMMKNSFLKLRIEDALIIKENKVINPEDLKAGDRLYIVRDDMQCKVIVVKD
ncbi:hypothetical protein SAMN02745883_01265 [Caminicella sporogenes DSM 14501]|uniref:Uncharacterized protein n=1 Tax=Caminicella sporogenes DSM 14501 TaxID=1121266 RepID=A0A1M6PQQ5_9FIRM|nr:hypothetical protein [Caminicella sporogenes]RKD22016.1 hypothetical protein BET04_07130 [Caminicella sporogenes]SHK10211.1 hypothetical protein SAMN02745883_01265 [Caminicella sporogenes DSM 14501]